MKGGIILHLGIYTLHRDNAIGKTAIYSYLALADIVIISKSVDKTELLSLFSFIVREWSLITGRGGATKREGGAREVLPLRKGGAEKVLAILKGGHKKFWGRFYVVA